MATRHRAGSTNAFGAARRGGPRGEEVCDQEPPAGDYGDRDRQQHRAGDDDELVGHVLGRQEAEEWSEQRKRDDAGEQGLLQRPGRGSAACLAGNRRLALRRGDAVLVLDLGAFGTEVDRRCGVGHGHTFSTSGRPRMPCGRKMSTIARIE